jgi:hypothetical protein
VARPLQGEFDPRPGLSPGTDAALLTDIRDSLAEVSTGQADSAEQARWLKARTGLASPSISA